ncbi:MAG TPA: hypothetical protein VKF17_04120 [Isosphaeraceae bacterium]|nr:hypothetical protein [Isosphaeraceae bacterium]
MRFPELGSALLRSILREGTLAQVSKEQEPMLSASLARPPLLR